MQRTESLPGRLQHAFEFGFFRIFGSDNRKCLNECLVG